MRLTALAVLMLAGCASGYREMSARLPASEADAFVACDAYLRPRICPATGPGGAGAAQSVCMSDVAEQYTALPGAAARQRFLVEAGCPSPISTRYFGGER